MSRKGKGRLVFEGSRQKQSGDYKYQVQLFNEGFQFIINKYGSKNNPDHTADTIKKKVKTLFYKVFDAHVKNKYRPIITYNSETKEVSFRVQLKEKSDG